MTLRDASGSLRTYADDGRTREVGQACSTREVPEQRRPTGRGGNGGKGLGQREPAPAAPPIGHSAGPGRPDALERVLTFAREYTRGRLIVVFGCGGDRDRGKRPRMGEVAARVADAVFATSDNPRSEDPEAILGEIEIGLKKTFANAKGHATIPDRREAIGAALASARGGDLVVIAGKGHETYQILRDRTIPFDDRVVAREALTALGYGVPGAGPLAEDR